MRIDAYTHFFPKKFFDKMIEVAGQYKDMGKRVRAIPPLYDLDARKKIIDTHKDYQQIIAYPQPPIEKLAKSPQQIDEYLPHHQRRLRRIVRQGIAIFPRLDRAGLARRAGRRRRPKPNAPSRWARSACRSTPTSPASRSTGRNICRSGKR